MSKKFLTLLTSSMRSLAPFQLLMSLAAAVITDPY